MYRKSIVQAEELVKRADAIANYLRSLRGAIEEVIFNTATDETEFTNPAWRCEVAREWATRTYMCFGHSDLGRNRYQERIRRKGKEPYRDDPVGFGDCYPQIRKCVPN